MDFLASLVNCSKLERLGLDSNMLGGSLTEAAANLSIQMTHIAIADNQLSETVPSGVKNLVNLVMLDLSLNQFTGALPASIGQLPKLHSLSVFSNRLSGKIPSSIGNISLLSILDLHDNRLQGTIPPSLASCENLLQLDLSLNNLNGTITNEVFSITSLSILLNLSRNHFTGSLPSAVGNLRSLSEMDISWNKLSGEIPASLGDCIKLEKLHLQHNFFGGSIPSSFRSLRGIQNLDVSHNNLTGLIPSYLQTIPLLYLNLSSNSFEGEVPKLGIFGNKSALSVQENDRLCGGIPELELPRCPTENTEHQKFSSLELVLIIIGCLLLGLAILLLFVFCLFKKRKDRILRTSLEESYVPVSYENILRATDGFSPSNLIGIGSFSSVYKGRINDSGAFVAIKVLNLQRRGATRSFRAECEALRNIRHRNLVKIITACSSIDFQGNDFKALIYEYMPNGSLEK
ncbi:receptor kinase-like protein Xa21 [Euphorbia lathyris]|uniref:receptor kinase-like protein Xa21 n=1 Tax=Euphorbia lathyris TaxID=212925 RepID=UPI00331317A2